MKLLLLFATVLATPATLPKVWLDTDIGTDFDDSLALSLLLEAHANKRINLLGISTLGPLAYQKSQIARFIVSIHNLDVPVYTGIGSFWKNATEFSTIYPNWPHGLFGAPYSDKFYDKQGLAYQDHLHAFYRPGDSDPQIAIDAFRNAVNLARKDNQHLSLVTIGPMINAAKFAAIENFNRDVVVIVQGGWDNDKPAYNSGINPESAQTVFDSGASIILVNEKFIRDFKFGTRNAAGLISKIDDAGLTGKREIVWNDWKNWLSLRKAGNRPMVYYDPCAAYVAMNPGKFKAKGVRFQLNLAPPDPSTGFRSDGMVKVEFDEDSQVRVIDEDSIENILKMKHEFVRAFNFAFGINLGFEDYFSDDW